jgi:hypothetical protein
MSDDWHTVQQALEHAHSFATGLRYCGMQNIYRETGEALEALKRLRQPSFFDGYPRHSSACASRRFLTGIQGEKMSYLETLLLEQIRQAKLPEPVYEPERPTKATKIIPGRKFAFDFVYPSLLLSLFAGRHRGRRWDLATDRPRTLCRTRAPRANHAGQ